jgi:integrase
MCTHLQKRGAVYYFRRTIPKNLQSAFGGKAQWMHSLATKDMFEAKRLARLAGIETDRLIVDATRAIASTETLAGVTQSRAHYANPLDEGQFAQAEYDERESDRREAEYEQRAELREAIAARVSGEVESLAPEEAAFKDLLADEKFERETLRLQVMHLQFKLAESAANGPESPRPDLVAPAANMGVADQGKAAAMLDPTIIDLWATERRVKPKGIAAHKAIARWLHERIGEKPASAITRADVLTFKTKLVAEGQSAANIKMKLSRLRTTLQWAFDNDYVSSNVAAGVRIRDTAAARNKRQEFDLASLNTIFSSPVYADAYRPTQARGEAAYWLPLLALFTGARMEELGQLRPSDIGLRSYPDADGVERSAHFIRITEDTSAGLSLKNANSERDVPLHSELVRLGFLAYVESVTAQGHARLFYQLKANIYGTYTAKWGEWFGNYKRSVCAIIDGRMTFHSFRHTFKHYARHVGMVEGIQRQIMGHSSGDVADDYGSGYSLHQLVEGMAQFKVAGLKLPAPSQVSLT